MLIFVIGYSLQWRYNGRDGVSNQASFFRRISKKISTLGITGLCAGNSPVSGEFPTQMASNVQNVSIWWRHHVGYTLFLAKRRQVLHGSYRIHMYCGRCEDKNLKVVWKIPSLSAKVFKISCTNESFWLCYQPIQPLQGPVLRRFFHRNSKSMEISFR